MFTVQIKTIVGKKSIYVFLAKQIISLLGNVAVCEDMIR